MTYNVFGGTLNLALSVWKLKHEVSAFVASLVFNDDLWYVCREWFHRGIDNRHRLSCELSL